jgi:hypothetical protein
MKTCTSFLVSLLLLGNIFTAEAASNLRAGLVAHYFKDADNWDGNWPDTISVPAVAPKDWTFTDYRYSRVEPVINHLFEKQGWFSVRWTGWIDTSIKNNKDATSSVRGLINVNPRNKEGGEFYITLETGRSITRDDLKATAPDYLGMATWAHFNPKGNANTNSLIVDGAIYPLRNGESYDVISEGMTVKLYNDSRNAKGEAMGKWWLEIEAEHALIFSGVAATAQSEKADTPAKKAVSDGNSTYVFEMLADDGCRLFIDNKPVIDSWQPCWEGSPDAVRRKEVELDSGRHRFVVEYFQGQSLEGDDKDPIKLFWSCAARGIPRQLISSSHFSHTKADTTSSGR